MNNNNIVSNHWLLNGKSMSCQRHNNPFLHLSSALKEHFLEGIYAPLRLMTQMRRVTNTQIHKYLLDGDLTSMK